MEHLVEEPEISLCLGDFHLTLVFVLQGFADDDEVDFDSMYRFILEACRQRSTLQPRHILVDALAMSNPYDLDDRSFVLDFSEYAIYADPPTPSGIGALKLLSI